MALAPPASQKKKAAGLAPVLVDEELWFGAPNSDAAETAAARSMAATAGLVMGAKPFPAAAQRLAELARNESTKTGELVKVLEQDPALSAKLLRMVNSAGFGLRQRCATVRHAVTLVGSEQLYRMATTAAVLDLFDSQSAHAVQILEHSAVVGAFCRYFGVHLSLRAEELFTAGVLHDIGKLMLIETLGDDYGQLIDGCDDRMDTMFSLERERYGYDHGVLAAHVLKQWNIPDPIPKIVAWHHEPSRAYSSSSQHAAFVQTLRLADALERAFTDGQTREQVEAIASLEAANYLDISAAQLMTMYAELALLRDSTLAHARNEGSDQESTESHTGIRHKVVRQAVAEVPRQCPCVSCGGPTFGATCGACRGYVCPEHSLNDAGWCLVCSSEYDGYIAEHGKSVPRLSTLIAAIVVTSICTLLGPFSGFEHGLARGLTGGLLLSVFFAAGSWLVERTRLRTRFLQARPDRSPPAV